MAGSGSLTARLPVNARDSGRNQMIPRLRSQQVVAQQTVKTINHTKRKIAESFSNVLHLHNIETPLRTHQQHEIFHNVVMHDHENTPTMSPKEAISEKLHDMIHERHISGALHPLQPSLRREIIKYGEFAQATYDAFDFDSFSEYCGSCRYNPNKLFDQLGLTKNGYNVSNYIYAMSHIKMPQWLERSHLLDTTWSKDSNWMGYVAVSDDVETTRIGRRDIMVAWRGTVAPSEWYEDFQRKLEPISKVHKEGDQNAKVEHGFLSLYITKSESTRYNKHSASEQVMMEIKKLVQHYTEKGEDISVTITGHSLGGALALLNAHEVAKTFPNLLVSVISFGAPRVGNVAFRDVLNQLGVKTLRVVVKQDLVPRMPGLVFNESLQAFDEITGSLEWVYTHVGAELKLDVQSSPYLKRGGFNLIGFHSLETYLHLVDGFDCLRSGFRSGARRDVALVNKACDMLVDELRIPHCWYQLGNKGLVCNKHGRWVKPKREPEDIPSANKGLECKYEFSI